MIKLSEEQIKEIENAIEFNSESRLLNFIYTTVDKDIYNNEQDIEALTLALGITKELANNIIQHGRLRIKN